jgi:translation initiation factor 2B subunit (eIF-2B alpha/beta/delta family)
MNIPVRIQDELAEIGGDRVSGATGLVLRGIGVLREAAGHRELLQQVADTLCRAQPSMAGFRTAAALALTAPEPIAKLDALAARVRRAPSSIARLAVPLMQLRRSGETPLRIVTCSRSTVVEHTILELARRERLRVCCAESRPGREGIGLAESLASEGLEVELFPDAAIGSAVPGAEVVAVGADAVSRGGFINKVGTAALAALARVYGVAVFVLAGAEKILPDPVLRALPVGEWPQVAAAGESSSAGYTVRTPLFERVPAELAMLVVTDRGALSFDDLDQASLWPVMSIEDADNMLDRC